MKNNQHLENDRRLYKEYPDLLDGGEDADPNLLRLVRDLDTACAPSQPPAHLSASIAQALAEYAEQRQHVADLTGVKLASPDGRRAAPLVETLPMPANLNVQRRTKWLPATRLGWAAVLLIAFLTLSAGAYAVLPPLGQAFHIAGIDQIEQANLGQQVDYRQTINGHTVIVKRVYADANRIIIGYVVEQPGVAGPASSNNTSDTSDTGDTSGNVRSANEKLTGDGGAAFQPMIGAGSGVQGGEAGYVLTYDAADEAGLGASGASGNPGEAPQTFNLHFTMDLTSLRQSSEAQPAPTAQQTGPDSWAVEAQPLHEEKVAGPFTFNFSVPVTQGRIAEVHQTAHAAGVDVTLERGVVTPSETRFYLRYAPPDGRTDLEWTPTTSLQVNGQRRGDQAILGGKRLSSDTWFSSILAPLYGEEGEWTLTVDELVGMYDLSKPLDSSELDKATRQERLRGPWTFKFTIPPAPPAVR